MFLDKKNISLCFFGTSRFSAIIFDALLKAGWNIIEIVTMPDEPKGRTQTLTPPEMKLEAQKAGVAIYQPANFKDEAVREHFARLKSDLIIVASYGKIIPEWLLALSKFKCLNVHPSLLPKYRGPSPIQTAILNGDTETGVTIMLMDKEMDHGPIIKNLKLKIKNYSYRELEKKLANSGAGLLIDILPQWLEGKIKPQEQDHSQASFTKIFSKDDGKIDWQKSAKEIERMARAFEPWPGIWTTWQGKRLRIIKASFSSEISLAGPIQAPGTVFSVKNDPIYVICGQNGLVIHKLQLESKKPLLARDFVRGQKGFIGSKLE